MKDKTITTKQFNLMAKHIVSILSGENSACSIRYLLYHVMGLGETYYSYFYPAGQDLTNALGEVTWFKAEAEIEHNYLETLKKDFEQLQAELKDLRNTVQLSCNPPDDCNDPVVLKTYMKACYEKAKKGGVEWV